MKSPTTAASALSLLSSLLLFNDGITPANASTTTMSVGTCEELQAAAAATASGDVVAELTTSGIGCDGWTTMVIDSNKLKILHPESSVISFTFSDIRFVVGSAGTLRIDNEVEFSQDEDSIVTQEVNGGVLNVEAGGYARFLGRVEIGNIVVRSDTGGQDFSSDIWYGGAIYNQGFVRFDQHAVISGCESIGGGESGPGDGGAIYNGENGKINFRNGVSMVENRSYDDGQGSGGAIFNLGRITVKGEASEFKDNVAAKGGGIYNEGEIDFSEVASFVGNRGVEGKGGHILNRSDVTLEGGALFYGGYAETGGALGLEAGSLTIEGPAMFVGNEGYWFGGGAVYVDENASFVTDNADVVLLGNVGGDDECDDIYYLQADGEFTCSS